MKPLLLVLFICLSVLSERAASTSTSYVYGFSPNTAHIGGRDIVTITGVGFRTYSEVVCLWDLKWAAFESKIVNDRTITCETPVIPLSDFIGGVPQTTTLTIIFDGDISERVDFPNSFVFGPSLTSFSPTNGFVAGAYSFTVRGTNFRDFTNASIFFDTTPATSVVILNDTTLTAVVPPGQYNQNAVISVYFNGNNTGTYLHFNHTFHYGPIFTTTTPPCGSYQGGSLVALTGFNLNDPIVFNSTLPPVQALPTVEVVYGTKRYFATGVTYDGNSVQFITPAITDQNVFGQDVDVYVHFKGIDSKVTHLPATVFRYGPIVYNTAFPTPGSTNFQNPTPGFGHSAGGDVVAIDGCGFSAFTIAQISPMISTTPGNFREFCIRGSAPGSSQDTLVISSCGSSCERLLCYTAPGDCNTNSSLSKTLDVVFRPSGANFLSSYTLPPVNESPLSFVLGPQVNTVSASRGSWTGGEVITVTGTSFYSNGLTSTAANPGWTITAVYTSAVANANVSYTVPVTVVSDTKLTFVAPQTLFGLSSTIQFNFGSSCLFIPRGSSFPYHSGPLCTSISPSNDYLSGGKTITITGVGFLEDGLDGPSNIFVQLCLDRLNPGATCNIPEPLDQSTVHISNTQITLTTPSIRTGVSTLVGGNRLFGDETGIYVSFENVPQSSIIGNSSVATLFCGDYRYGPVVSALTPDKGPSGPEIYQQPGTRVTITGSAFSDPLYNTNIETAFESGYSTNDGYIFGFNTGTNGVTSATQDKRITTQTSFGGNANSQVELITIFNTCNSTTSDFVVTWGPIIESISVTNIQTTNNGTDDIYGVLPSGGQIVAVVGQGFDEFFSITNNVTSIDARCLIDGVPVTTTTDGDRTIFCVTPARDFGSIVNVSIAFGFIGCSEFDDINYRQIVTAEQQLYYTPIIYDFSPVYGITSGGTSVTISGEGFANWASATCYFGHYTEGVHAQVSTDGFTVTCNTPYHRGEFNTDVTVNVIMDGLLDENVIAPYKYHYGPLCTDINPSFGYISGNISANILGGDFIDCTDSGSASPFINCTFTQILVSINSSTFGNGSLIQPDGITDDNIAFFLPPSPSGCADSVYVGLYFPDVNVSTPQQKFVNCSNAERPFFYRYGPLVYGAFSEFYRESTAYGWQDDSVTIYGISLDDSDAGNYTCYFGNVSSTTSFANSSAINCFAPNGTWNTYVNLNLNYSGGAGGCPLNFTAGRFHYGPVLDSVTPTFGYVAGATPITISGFAFACCGIDFYECLMPPTPDDPNYPVINVGQDQVTCNVPHNQDIDVLIENIGVLFESPLFPNPNSTIYNLTLTEAGTSLTYYYGPIITGFTPNRASLSGSGSAITISGVGFSDPYFDATGVFCDYFTLTKGFNSTTIASSVVDNEIVCPISSFDHRCGDKDNLRPRWSRFNSTQLLRPELGPYYVKTKVPPLPAPRKVNPFFGDGGSSTQVFQGPIFYGPSILSVETTVGAAPAGSPSGELVSWVSGGLNLLITLDNIQDWVTESTFNDFGTEKAWCVFGNFASESLSQISFGSNTINCTVPYGVFNYTGAVRVILDPHFDESTSFIPNVSSDWWHWLPYSIGVSKVYSGVRGYQSFVVEGAGFCAFDSVVCSFSGVEGVQSDILNDFQVVCQAPPLDAGIYNLQLDFCSETFCTPGSSDNTIPVTNNWSVVGIVDIQPREGPLCGGTTITVKGYGFHLFAGLGCSFNNGRQTAVATYVNDNTVTCVTPNLAPHSLIDSVSCNTFDLVGFFPSLGSVSMPSPYCFETGLPRVFASDPTFAYLETTSQVVIAGEYFNGGRAVANGGAYYCKFGDIVVDATIHTFTDSALESISTIVCNTPTIFDFPSLTVGTVYLEIKFDCLQGSYTINRLPFEFKQKPAILSFSPSFGAETGGSLITVVGEHLAGGSQYLCSFGTLGIDNQVISAFYSSIYQELTCFSPAHLVTRDGLQVDFAISLDGGDSWYTALTPFEYRNVIIDCNGVDQQLFPTLPKDVNSANSVLPSSLSSVLFVSLLVSFFLFF